MSRPFEPLSISGIQRASGCSPVTIRAWLHGKKILPASETKITDAIRAAGGTVISNATPKEARMPGANS